MMKTILAMLVAGVGMSGLAAAGALTMDPVRYSSRAAVIPQPSQVSKIQPPLAEGESQSSRLAALTPGRVAGTAAPERVAATYSTKPYGLAEQTRTFELAPLKAK